jgi:hypothetical protein
MKSETVLKIRVSEGIASGVRWDLCLRIEAFALRRQNRYKGPASERPYTMLSSRSRRFSQSSLEKM